MILVSLLAAKTTSVIFASFNTISPIDSFNVNAELTVALSMVSCSALVPAATITVSIVVGVVPPSPILSTGFCAEISTFFVSPVITLRLVTVVFPVFFTPPSITSKAD